MTTASSAWANKCHLLARCCLYLSINQLSMYVRGMLNLVMTTANSARANTCHQSICLANQPAS
eukprot:15476490-Alexandrium_andersonii.AAC.1